MSAGYVALLRRNADFRRLWLGQVVSLLGDWFNLVATSTLIESLTGSGAAVGQLFALRMLAPFCVSPLAGVVADRFDRRRVLVATDVLRAVVVLGFLLVRERGDVPLLYVLTFVQLALSGFFFPAYRAVLPDLVRPHELGAANALGAATWSTMLALGAACGGWFAGRFGVASSFVVDAATFVVSAALVARIATPSHSGADASGRGVRGAVRDYVDGLGYLRTHRDVLFVALHKTANALCVAGGFQVVQTALAQREFVIGKDGSTGLGLIWAAVGVGTGIGPIVVRRLVGDEPRRLRRALAASYLCSSLGLACVAVASAFPLVLTGALLRGIGAGVGWVFSTQLLLVLVPARVRGRVFAAEFALLTLASATGSWLAGRGIDVAALGTRGVLFVMSAAALLPAALWTAWTVRHPDGAASTE